MARIEYGNAGIAPVFTRPIATMAVAAVAVAMAIRAIRRSRA